jgi:arabinose-5-phosphate isomerase
VRQPGRQRRTRRAGTANGRGGLAPSRRTVPSSSASLTPRELAARVLRLEAEGIHALIPRLDDAFDRAVALIGSCRGRVIVCGMGKSGLVGRKIAATLASTGTPAYFLHPAEGVHGDLGMVAKGDVILAISNSGETDEMLAILPPLKRLGAPIVLLTGNLRSALARQCEVVLDVSVTEEACPMNLTPTTSTTAVLALGDALAMVLLDQRRLRPEDYAALHPRGTLGWRSLVRVRDLMHTGAAIPQVGEATALKDVITEMTAKRLGMTAVVDGEGRLAGIITDGDVRRMLLRDTPLLDVRARDCMTRQPKCIDDRALAAKALETMESFAITSLMIVDADRRPLGVIHMHDVLRAKIV